MQEIRTDFEVVNTVEDTSLMRRLELSPWIIIRHTLLFLLTFASVAFTYLQFAITPADGIVFAACFLLFLATHEFGHYFAAVHHRIRTSLPWFIPMPLVAIGTMGAVIRIKDPISDTKRLFDIGIAGPAAGFVVSVVLLCVGFATLPSPEHVFEYPGHEALKDYVATHGAFPDNPPGDDGETLFLGTTLFYAIVASFFSNVPPMYEMYHYPVLFAGWLGLFFTALNLMPFGQLDGGHILYALFNRERHQFAAYFIYALLSGLAGVGGVALLLWSSGTTDFGSATLSWLIWGAILHFLFRFAYRENPRWITPLWGLSLGTSLFVYNLLPQPEAALNYGMWLFWLFFVVFFVRLDHPPATIRQPLGRKRRILGWTAIIIFFLCMSPLPFYFR